MGDVTYEKFYENGTIKQKRVIQEILSKEENSVNTIDKVIKYDKEGNITSTETKKDYIYTQP